MSLNTYIQHNTIQLSPATQDHYQPKNESLNCQFSQQELLKNYESLMSEFSYAKVCLRNISQEKLQQHKITILLNTQQRNDKYKIIENAKDFIFSVVQTQFYGLEYIYEIVISNFLLKINVLNLQRQSDTGEDDVDSKEVGTGSFGVVRVLKINGKEYAVKRIPFQYKLQSEEGYDYQVNKREHLQLREALKQYCYFKIFSALGIGPKIVKTNYDLICFNNCIEFKMELCEPLISKLADNQEQFNFQQCKNQLYQKLAMLHSLNFVHRDIKPQNILYNTERSFFFGDFGLVSYVKEKYNQKTQTRFAGTPNYCGSQMSKLLNGGFGLVNLYLNDYFCLQKCFSAMQEFSVSHNSRISQNSLSYYDSGSYFQSNGNSFESTDRQAVSESNFTDETYIPTRNSVITIPTAHTLAPKRYASSINHYQSQIIYRICREKQRRQHVNQNYLIQLIQQRYNQHNNEEISLTLLIELQRTFQTQDPESEIINALKQWKSLSRHFGPQDIRTIKRLQALSQIAGQKSAAQLKIILNKLSQYQSSSNQYRLELIFMQALQNRQNYVFSFISYLKSLLKQSLHNKSAILENDCIFVAQKFISLLKAQKKATNQVLQINHLVRKIFKLQQTTIKNSIVQTLKFTLKYLRSKNEATVSDAIGYITFLQQYQNWQIFQCPEVYGTVVKQINYLLINFQKHSEEIKLSLIYLLTRLSLSSFTNQQNPLAYKIHLQKATQIIDQQIARSDKNQAKNYKILLLLQRMRIFYYNKDYQQALKIGQAVELYVEQQHYNPKEIRIYASACQILGNIFLKIEKTDKALTSYNKGLKALQQHGYSLNNAQITFLFLNNLAAAYDRLQMTQKYDQTLDQLVDFLEKSTYNKKYQKLTYIFQLKLRRLSQIGLVNQQIKQLALRYVQKIIQCFYNFCIHEGIRQIYLKHQNNYHLVNVSKCGTLDKNFILEAVADHIKSKPQYFQTFHYQYSFSNYELAMYYRSQPYKNLECMKYIWRSLKAQLQRYHPSQLTKMDYISVNLYALCLIRAKSNRVAIRFLNKILKYIPECYKDIRFRAFKIMYRALKTIGSNKENLFYQLTKNNCQRLNGSLITLPQKLSKQPRFRLLQLKYAKKICYYQFTQLEQRQCQTDL